MLAEIQLDMLPADDVAGNDLAIMRSQRIKAFGGPQDTQLALARIQLEPHAGQWMWAVSVNSANGYGSGYIPLAKWKKFAPTRKEAISRAVDELRQKLERLTADERVRVVDWLGAILPAHELGRS